MTSVYTTVLIFVLAASSCFEFSNGKIVQTNNYENEVDFENGRLVDPEEVAYNNFIKRIRNQDYGLPPRITNSITVPKIYERRENIPPFDIQKFIEHNLRIRKPVSKLFYYAHPLEEFRYEYQPMVRRTFDGEPEEYQPASWRANRGYGFNEWAAQPIL